MARKLLERKGIEAALLLMLSLGPACRIQSQQKPEIAPPSKSDSFATDEKGRKFRVQHGELAKENFQIAGVDLVREGEVIKQAARIIGPVQTRATGDASTGDERSCYKPVDKGDSTRLYFHEGEVDSWFVLSSEAPPAERADVCRPSRSVARGISTASGLHLGQTEEEVIALLGLPTRRSHNAKTGAESLVYDYEIEKKASTHQLENARRENPSMGEQELLRNYGSFEQLELVKAEFAGDALAQLQVDWSAQD